MTHVMKYDNDDEEELETIKEKQEEQMTMEERMIRDINSIGGKPKVDTLIYYDSLNPKE